MKKRTLIHSLIVIVISSFQIIFVNPKAFDQFTIYFPIVSGRERILPGPELRILNIFYDGVKPGEADEYVEIVCYYKGDCYLNNYTLRNRANDIFTFPNHVMRLGDVCRIYSNEYHREWCGFTFGSEIEIWNNEGDTATFRNGDGLLRAEYSY